MFSDVLFDPIFSDFLTSAELNVDPGVVSKACYDLIGANAGVVVSNGPDTYHSEVSNSIPDTAIGTAINQSMHFADSLLKEKYNVGLADKLDWWLNETCFGGYNAPHIHGRADIIAIYYPKVPPGSSALSLTRNDGSNYTKLYNKIDQTLNLDIKEGRVYMFPGHIWHYVEAQTTVEKRLSISMNLYLH